MQPDNIILERPLIDTHTNHMQPEIRKLCSGVIVYFYSLQQLEWNRDRKWKAQQDNKDRVYREEEKYIFGLTQLTK